jgi:hypothetical protein
MKKIIAVLIACLFACSGGEQFDEDLVIEQEDQALSAKVSPTYQHGSTTSSTHLACNKTNSGQVCTVPSTKNVSWAFDTNSGFSNTEKTNIRAIVQSFDNTLTTWSFSETTDPAASQLVFKVAACSGGSSSSNIEAFGCVSLAFSANLTEGAGVVGSYQKHGKGTISIDVTDINAKYASQGDRDHLKTHAVGHSILAWMGVGARSDAGVVHYMSRRTVSLGNFNLTLTTGELCRADSFLATNDGQFSLTTPACTVD